LVITSRSFDRGLTVALTATGQLAQTLAGTGRQLLSLLMAAEMNIVMIGESASWSMHAGSTADCCLVCPSPIELRQAHLM
jgi:hypothetical protein